MCSRNFLFGFAANRWVVANKFLINVYWQSLSGNGTPGRKRFVGLADAHNRCISALFVRTKEFIESCKLCRQLQVGINLPVNPSLSCRLILLALAVFAKLHDSLPKKNKKIFTSITVFSRYLTTSASFVPCVYPTFTSSLSFKLKGFCCCRSGESTLKFFQISQSVGLLHLKKIMNIL